MPNYDPMFQESHDGPLTKSLRDRISAFRPEYNLQDIGVALGLSGAFVSTLLRDKDPANVRSIHIPRIVAAVEKAERERKNKEPVWGVRAATAAAAAGPAGGLSLEALVQAIKAKGFTVCLTTV